MRFPSRSGRLSNLVVCWPGWIVRITKSLNSKSKQILRRWKRVSGWLNAAWQGPRKLEQQQTASEELLDQREADLAVLFAQQRGALSELERAKVNVSRCTIRSPYTAVITSRSGAVGEFADVGTRLLEIMDIEQLEISAQVPARDIAAVEQAEEIYFEDTAERYAVTLRTVTPTVNTQTRNREVRLLFSNASALPGAAGKLIWRDRQPHISAKLLVRRNNDFGIFINDNGKARFHIIPGAQQGRTTPVDLPPDTIVVTEGQYRLEDGQSVIPV